MLKKLCLAILGLIVIAPLSANYLDIKKQYCSAEQIIFSKDRILVQEGDNISEVKALFSDEKGIYFITDNQCHDNNNTCKYSTNFYKNVCNKPNCPHGK